MYVCICRQVTDHQIRDVCRRGSVSFRDLQAQTGIASECGKCGNLAQAIVKEYSKSQSFVNAA